MLSHWSFAVTLKAFSGRAPGLKTHPTVCGPIGLYSPVTGSGSLDVTLKW